MTLPAGSRFGPYEVLSPLGAGGMGEVYRARDSRLGREVALKVLPEELSQDRGRLGRFEQEARSASALNHPNIVTIHEIGQEDGTSYISMELVDGKTLRELLMAGPLPLRRLLGIAVQVAEGLAKAHAVGIVHRDLKPENVMVSKDGFAKILDFGLAKLVEPQSGDVTAMPTLAETHTKPGTVMGTVAYMSPEQASGLLVDFRSDQFSLGSILHEITSGQKAFERKTAAETMSAIIREDPEPLGKLRPEAPPPLRWIIERCLAKEPEERYASTRDLARELASVRDHISEIASGAQVAVGEGPRRKSRLAPLLAIGLVALLAALGGWLAARGSSEKATAPSFRRLTFRTGALQNARFTPDGQTIVYGATWAGELPGLYAVRPESPESRPFNLEADILAVSSSGEMAVHLDANPLFGTLAFVPFAGGVPRPAVERVPYASADWAPAGKEMAIVRFAEGDSRLEFPIGKVLYKGPEINAPRFDPRGESIAFFQRGKTGSVMVIQKSGQGVKPIASGFQLPGGAPCWRPDGGEVWFTGTPEPGRPSGLHAADLTGNVRLVAQMPGELELDDISRDGRVLFAHHTLIGSLRGRTAGESVERDLTWLDSPLVADISPDGREILFSETGEAGGKSASVYLRKLDGSPAVRLGEGRALALSPDGQTALVAVPGAADRLVLLPRGAGEPRTLALQGYEEVNTAAWLPDGKSFIFGAREPGKNWRVYRISLEEGKPHPVSDEGVRIPFFMTGPVSPDGRWFLATRVAENFLRFPTEGGQPRPIAGLERGDSPIRWGSDGSLYGRPPRDGDIWRLDPDTGRKTPVAKLSTGPAGMASYRIVVTPDGRSHAYSAVRAHSILYVVEGLR